MNPASLKINLKWAKPGCAIIIDFDTFDKKALEKAGYDSNPLENGSLADFKVIKAAISTQTAMCSWIWI